MKTNEIKIEVENIKIETNFEEDMGATAEITGTYHGKSFFVYVQGGRDEEGDFERVACPDCETTLEVGGKGIDYDTSICELLEFDEDLEDEVYEAFEDFLEEHLGPERYWDYGYPLDRFGNEAEIRDLEHSIRQFMTAESFRKFRAKYENKSRDEYFEALKEKDDEFDEIRAEICREREEYGY